MSLHYNAFISYKHAPLDNKVAAEIEKQLERYHIPKKIQKKTGVKKIERIFRDKDELPITSDLTDTINEALLNSDYLIVLCSRSTHLSTWVEREIRLFLQTHPLDHVLTVLAEGEPYEVIPPILLSRQVQRYNSWGQIETVTEPVEPLSCDWRLPAKEARTTELPRLAAALIGCSYNELMNRQRQYKMRRMSAIAAGVMGLSVGFGAYMLYSNQRINENYQQSLRNQSRYLANSSEQLLKDERRIDALHLALASLPNEDNPDRPVIPEAVRAINKASLAYVTQSGSNVTAVWNYSMPDAIDNYVFADGGGSFAAIDKSHNVTVWNCENHQVKFQYNSASDAAEAIAFLDYDKILITGEKFLKVFSTETGSVVWEIESLKGPKYDASIDRLDAIVLDDGSFLISTLGEGIFKIDSTTGKVLDQYIIPTGDEWNSSEVISRFAVSPDQKKLAIIAKLGDEDREYNLINLDMGSHDYHAIGLETAGFLTSDDDYLENINWIDDGIYIAIARDTFGSSYGFLNMSVLDNSNVDIYCFNAEDMSTRWGNTLTYNAISLQENFADIASENKVLYYSGNVCELFDKTTGESQERYNLNESIIGVSVSKSDYSYSIITSGGNMGNPMKNRGEGSVAVINYFADNLQDVVVNRGIYAHEDNSSEIIYYGTGIYDENFEELDKGPGFEVVNNFLLDGDVIAMLGDDDTESFVDFFDANTKEYVGRASIGTDSSYRYELIGLENGIAYVTHDADDGFYLCKVDGNLLKSEEIGIVQDSYYGSTCGVPIVKDGKFIFFNSGETVFVDLETDEIQKFDTEQEYAGFKGGFEYSPEDKLIYFYGSHDYILNTETGETKEATHPSDWLGTKRAHIDVDKKVIITTDYNKVIVSDLKGEEISSIVCPDLDVFGFTLYTPTGKESKTQLIVVYSDGFLYRYDMETGEYIAKTELTYSSSTDNMTFEFDQEKSRLYVCGGKVLDIVDTDSWLELTYLTNAIGYHRETDSFIVYAYDTSHVEKIGYYKQYTLEELIQRAEDMVEGSEMSEDFKKSYGIG